jgi:flagellar hook-associated protein 1 FlgK
VTTAAIATSTIDRLTGSDYRLVSNGGVNYTLTRLSDNAVLVNGAPLPASIDGMAIAVGGVPVAGDSFLIQPTRHGARDVALAFSDPRLIAAAAPIRTAKALANTGTASISSGTVNAPPPTNANLQQTVTITFTGAATFNVTGIGVGLPAGGVAYTSGANITYNGWTTQISGTPAAGDVFTVSANAGGVADNRNAMLMGALQTKATMIGSSTSSPTASYQSAYSQIVGSVGSKTNEVQAIAAAQQGLLDHATQALQSTSGVNLDEEAANLLRYQQAYQASAKVLEIATKVFDEILALGR